MHCCCRPLTRQARLYKTYADISRIVRSLHPDVYPDQSPVTSWPAPRCTKPTVRHMSTPRPPQEHGATASDDSPGHEPSIITADIRADAGRAETKNPETSQASHGKYNGHGKELNKLASWNPLAGTPISKVAVKETSYQAIQVKLSDKVGRFLPARERGWHVLTKFALGHYDMDRWKEPVEDSFFAAHSPYTWNREYYPDFEQPIAPIYGYITSIRRSNSELYFFDLVDPHMRLSVQCKVDKSREHLISLLGELAPMTPVMVGGSPRPRTNIDRNQNRDMHSDKHAGEVARLATMEIEIDQIKVLNSVPSDVKMLSKYVYPPERRHLQFKTSRRLRDNIRTRTKVMMLCREFLISNGFDEIETPMLFKSTPEGAREFLVPTRQPGMAYALPQSPQQYKQILMASGFHKYFQFARCFRDEDLRSDRQPEFTQLDMEMSFSSRADFMECIERLLREKIFPHLNVQIAEPPSWYDPGARWALQFPTMSYKRAMLTYGSDKPDLRIPGELLAANGIVPEDMKSMLTSLDSADFEIFILSLNDGDQKNVSRKFIKRFMESAAAQRFINNPHGAPGVAIVDETRPLSGLASFGHSGHERLRKKVALQEGDIVITQARPAVPLTGGSTAIGDLRLALWQAAIEQDLVTPPTGLHPVWITHFPLFEPLSADEAASTQTQASGLKSTHHPFTAPVNPPRAKRTYDETLHLIRTDPLSLIGNHFDLVFNGVEIGGGSQRIHSAEVQEAVFRDALKLPDERVDDFKHLLMALRDGCPPHVGFAIGFDRLMSILLNTETIRDVIAFPKMAGGKDRFVGSPSVMTQSQLEAYNLSVVQPPEGRAPTDDVARLLDIPRAA
jgi:aspartyl-tRNA synthetase